MMMHRINKYNDDLLLQLDLECREGCFNIEKFRFLIIKLYTLNSTNFVEASYEEVRIPEFINIIRMKDQCFVSIQQPELEKLENGQLRCIVEYGLFDSNFDDDTYD
jgi:hypothetical protein